MTTAQSNNRASLLAGLRTGGVRSTSTSMPHTAAPAGTFNIPRFASQRYYPEEEEVDYLPEMEHFAYGNRQAPLTSAADGPNNRFAHHQQQQQQYRGPGMNPNSAPFTPSFAMNTPNNNNFGGNHYNNNANAYNANHLNAQANASQTQALQMQMIQMEVLRLQALQAQQLQADLLAQAQAQQAAQDNQRRRASLGFTPASAGPTSNGFDIRSASLSAQMRRARQDHQQAVEEPMTAALGGRFGSRIPSGIQTQQLPKHTIVEESDDNTNVIPPTPSSTTVISGGTSLGTPISKSESASSWRRADKNTSVLRQRPSPPSVSVKVTPPPSDESAAAAAAFASPTTGRTRPQPLRFSPAAADLTPAVTIDTSEGNDDDTESTGSSAKSSVGSGSPTSASTASTPLSPREEASKKLYEGLGLGRPRTGNEESAAIGHRMASSQPKRQPRGPPGGADELGPKNFASRIRRQAIGGLGMLMGARERREVVAVF